jgi:hypothetical protein
MRRRFFVPQEREARMRQCFFVPQEREARMRKWHGFES